MQTLLSTIGYHVNSFEISVDTLEDLETLKMMSYSLVILNYEH